MNNNDVIHLLEKSSTKADTEFSKNIFDVYEEGKEDTDIIAGRLNKNRRDWLILADLYNDQKYTQKFHLLMYLKFKRKLYNVVSHLVLSQNPPKNISKRLFCSY